MKLYLSSFLLGNHPEKLLELAGNGKRAVLILNALDNSKPESREKYKLSQTEGLQQLGFDVMELDLRNYFGKPDDLKEHLSQMDVVWVNGGNTFVLRRAMEYSGFDTIITERIKANTIVYAGFSAGVVLLYKSLKGLDIIDDPNGVPEGYNDEIIWDGLGIIDYAVAVHYDSDHPESALMDEEIAYYKKNNIPYKPLRDGEVIIIDGDKEELIGL